MYITVYDVYNVYNTLLPINNAGYYYDRAHKYKNEIR